MSKNSIVEIDFSMLNRRETSPINQLFSQKAEKRGVSDASVNYQRISTDLTRVNGNFQSTLTSNLSLDAPEYVEGQPWKPAKVRNQITANFSRQSDENSSEESSDSNEESYLSESSIFSHTSEYDSSLNSDGTVTNRRPADVSDDYRYSKPSINVMKKLYPCLNAKPIPFSQFRLNSEAQELSDSSNYVSAEDTSDKESGVQGTLGNEPNTNQNLPLGEIQRQNAWLVGKVRELSDQLNRISTEGSSENRTLPLSTVGSAYESKPEGSASNRTLPLSHLSVLSNVGLINDHNRLANQSSHVGGLIELFLRLTR